MGSFRALEPVRGLLRTQTFIGGDTPRYADYILFGMFQWSRLVSDFVLLSESDPMRGWEQSILQYFPTLFADASASSQSL